MPEDEAQEAEALVVVYPDEYLDAPYSHFGVGVVLVLQLGMIVATVVARWSEDSLYSEAHVTFEEDAGAYDQKDAEGFIRLNALRLRDGFPLSLFEDTTGVPREAPEIEVPLASAAERGWLERDGDTVRPSAQGYRFLNDLQMLFLPREGE